VGWIDALRGETVALDTAPLIYFIEEHPVHAGKLQPFFEAAEHGEFQVVTSYLTLLEVLVHPLRMGRDDLVREYRNIFLRSASLRPVSVDDAIAAEGARLRALYNVRTPDAIHLATALQAGAKWFLTNDLRLPALTGLSILTLDHLPAA